MENAWVLPNSSQNNQMMVGVMEKTFLQQQLRVCVGGWVGVADGDCGNEKKRRNFIRIYFNNKKCVCGGRGGGK